MNNPCYTVGHVRLDQTFMVLNSRAPLPDWARIRTILLDMDGTLLDRHFDDHFWTEFVPHRYAEAKRIPLDEARSYLSKLYRDHEGTLNWYDVDFWSGTLGLDIPALKSQVDHLIAVHPHVIEFLQWVKTGSRTVCLVTNAHGKTLELKMGKTRLGGYFDTIVISHDLGFPKESLPFWDKARGVLGFDPGSTLLVDDSLPVLKAAEKFGIRYLVHIARPSSTAPAKHAKAFFSVETFREMMPDHD